MRWYQEKLRKLLTMGVGIFTADFGEAAPLTGIYHARASSFLEHNLYPFSRSSTWSIDWIMLLGSS